MDRKTFLDRRKQGIGGSDVAAVLGLSRWKTPFQLWQEKTNRIPDPEEETEFQHFGNILEQVVADEFCRRTGKKVQKRNKLFKHPEHPELIANIDRYVVGEKAILECKTSSAFKLSDWGESGTDEIPEYYMCQVQHYMHVTGYSKTYLAVLIGGNQYRYYVIDYDKELAEYLAERCIEFWKNHVLADMPPMVTETDDLASIYPGVAGEICNADDDTLRIVNEYSIAKEKEKQLKKEIETLSFNLKMLLGNAEFLVDEQGKTIMTYKKMNDSYSDIINWEKIATENLPIGYISDEIKQKYTEKIMTRKGNRVLKIKTQKEE